MSHIVIPHIWWRVARIRMSHIVIFAFMHLVHKMTNHPASERPSFTIAVFLIMLRAPFSFEFYALVKYFFEKGLAYTLGLCYIIKVLYRSLAQLAEQLTLNQRVVGSIPTGPTTSKVQEQRRLSSLLFLIFPDLFELGREEVPGLA